MANLLPFHVPFKHRFCSVLHYSTLSQKQCPGCYYPIKPLAGGGVLSTALRSATEGFKGLNAELTDLPTKPLPSVMETEKHLWLK